MPLPFPVGTRILWNVSWNRFVFLRERPIHLVELALMGSWRYYNKAFLCQWNEWILSSDSNLQLQPSCTLEWCAELADQRNVPSADYVTRSEIFIHWIVTVSLIIDWRLTNKTIFSDSITRYPSNKPNFTALIDVNNGVIMNTAAIVTSRLRTEWRHDREKIPCRSVGV